MNEDERPGDEPGQEEMIAAFAALGGPLTGDEFRRLLGSDEYYGTLVRLAALLLDGDAGAARDVARDSLAAAREAGSRLGDPEKARVYLRQAVVHRSRSVRRHRSIDGHATPQAPPSAPGARRAAAGYLDREPWVCALRALPARQREAVVLRRYLGLSEKEAAQAMGISIGAVGSHLARALSSLGPARMIIPAAPPGP